MTRLKALKDLKAKVEAGKFTPEPGGPVMPSYRRFVALADVALPQDVRALDVLAYDAYKGSLDAAKALHEAVLPDVRVQGLWETTERSWVAELCWRAHAIQVGYAVSITPARAWLLAILSALIAQEEQL
jgi:hypothetical protein